MTDLAKHSAILGNLKAVTKKFVMTPTKTRLIWSGICHAIQWEELFFFAFMGWGFVPLLGLPQNVIRDLLKHRFGSTTVRPYKRSYTKLIADQLASISRIGVVVYIVDVIKILLQAMGFKFRQLAVAPNVVAKSLVCVYYILLCWYYYLFSHNLSGYSPFCTYILEH